METDLKFPPISSFNIPRIKPLSLLQCGELTCHVYWIKDLLWLQFHSSFKIAYMLPLVTASLLWVPLAQSSMRAHLCHLLGQLFVYMVLSFPAPSPGQPHTSKSCRAGWHGKVTGLGVRLNMISPFVLSFICSPSFLCSNHTGLHSCLTSWPHTCCSNCLECSSSGSFSSFHAQLNYHLLRQAFLGY